MGVVRNGISVGVRWWETQARNDQNIWYKIHPFACGFRYQKRRFDMLLLLNLCELVMNAPRDTEMRVWLKIEKEITNRPLRPMNCFKSALQSTYEKKVEAMRSDFTSCISHQHVYKRAEISINLFATCINRVLEAA